MSSCLCFSDNRIQASRLIQSGQVVFWIFVGRLFSHLHPSRNLVRKIWDLVVPVQSSERLTFFDSIQMSLMTFSETWSTFVCVCFMTSKYLNGIGNVSSSGPYSFNRGSSRCRYHHSKAKNLLLNIPADHHLRFHYHLLALGFLVLAEVFLKVPFAHGKGSFTNTLLYLDFLT